MDELNSMNDVFKFQLVPGKPRRIFYDNNITDDECRPILYKKNRGVRFAALNPHTLAEIMADVRKDWRAARTKKYAQSVHGRETKQTWNQSPEGKAANACWSQSPKGKAAKWAWNQSPEGKAAKLTWNQSPKGKAARAALQRSPEAKAARATWRKTDIGQAQHQRPLASHRAKSLDRYLNRIIVGIDSEGRAPRSTIDSEGRAPLEAHKATGCLKHLTKDNSGHYWEPHELSLIGAAVIHRPYGTPIGDAQWQDPIWFELQSKNQTEQCFDALLSLPERFPKKPYNPLYLMFSAAYDWSMWCQDIKFNKAFEIAKERDFAPPCKLMRGKFFWGKYTIKIRPYYDFKLGELRWPDDPYGKTHMDDPLYEKPPKGQTKKLQYIRKIEIFDTYRLSPKSFVETIKPLAKRGLIPTEVFNTIEREKQKRGAFHLESMENVKKYCAMELHSLGAFVHMIRDACWTSDSIRLKSFHSPAAIASVL